MTKLVTHYGETLRADGMGNFQHTVSIMISPLAHIKLHTYCISPHTKCHDVRHDAAFLPTPILHTIIQPPFPPKNTNAIESGSSTAHYLVFATRSINKRGNGGNALKSCTQIEHRGLVVGCDTILGIPYDVCISVFWSAHVRFVVRYRKTRLRTDTF